jgi:hypothetical protein
VLQLTKSYRSVPAIQRFVNAAFSSEMTANDRRFRPVRSAVAVPERRRVAACDRRLPVPRPYATRGPLKASARPSRIAARRRRRVHGLADRSGERLAGRRSTVRWHRERVSDPAAPHRVLFRRFVNFGEDVTRPIPMPSRRAAFRICSWEERLSRPGRGRDVRAALAAIEWPDDELSVFATLKGSLFAIDERTLLEFRHRFGTFHPFRVPKELGGNSGQELALTGEPTSHLMPIAGALRLLQQLHRGRNYRPVADTIGRLLGGHSRPRRLHSPAGRRAGARQRAARRRAGAAVREGGGISFRGFIDELRARPNPRRRKRRCWRRAATACG